MVQHMISDYLELAAHHVHMYYMYMSMYMYM